MKIESYKTYISEIPLHKRAILTKNDKIAVLPIDDTPQILIRTRRELELKRTILRIKIKIEPEKEDKINTIIRNLFKNNNIETMLELLDNEKLITIDLYGDKARLLIGKIVDRESGTDLWNIARKGKLITDIEIIKRILYPLNIKIA
ncbi:MAG: hypothetical protein GXO10_06865 [Crenarchaeota archaeon]|nr:hypothetical protein [Thermoproteota archaeon]